jgi:uncharacterized membrane protein
MVMTDFFATPTVQAGIAVLILCVLIALAFYLLSSFRDYTAQDTESTREALIKLQEMHRRGDISDEEFRTMKARTQQQLDGSPRPHDPTFASRSSTESQS